METSRPGGDAPATTPADHVPAGSTDPTASASAPPPAAEASADATPENGDPASATAADTAAARKRRRGSRGGQRRRKGAALNGPSEGGDDVGTEPDLQVDSAPGDAAPGDSALDELPELPEPLREGRPSAEAAERALVRKPQIGDTRPAPRPATSGKPTAGDGERGRASSGTRSTAKRAARPGRTTADRRAAEQEAAGDGADRRKRGGRGRSGRAHDTVVVEQRKGRERKGRPVGRYLMCVQVRSGMAQVGVLEGRNLIEHYVSRPADDVSQIHGNIYLGRVQNVLPGMEAAFVDIATPKNAVLYRGDVQYDAEDIEERGDPPRIEDILRAKQLIVCQVTKNPIGAKGARLTQEVSLPGRYVVLIPNSKTYGISKRLPDDVRKRLRAILDRVKPAEHGLIVRTAAEHATEAELKADMMLLLEQWREIEGKAARTKQPALLYREPELAVRVIREEFNADYRGVVIDDERLHDEVRAYVAAFNPELADRIEYYDPEVEGLSLFEQFHVHEQVHKALDRKVWLPSGGSLIIEHTEALTVIDVNTGKNVGTSSLEQTVFHNNMEAADEIAKQLRLRDIGGIIVIDFIDMEKRENRARVVEAFRNALARDKTRSQVFDITDLGLVEMTRKRIGEGLLTEFSTICPECEGRGVLVDHTLLD
jgi:ribonuclease E